MTESEGRGFESRRWQGFFLMKSQLKMPRRFFSVVYITGKCDMFSQCLHVCLYFVADCTLVKKNEYGLKRESAASISK